MKHGGWSRCNSRVYKIHDHYHFHPHGGANALNTKQPAGADPPILDFISKFDLIMRADANAVRPLIGVTYL